jgi:hypothetical protein
LFQPDWLQDDSNEAGDGEYNDPGEEEMALPGSQHVLVLLDCRPEMFQQFLPGDPKFPDEKYSPMDVALAACENLVRAKVRTMTTLKTGKRDGFGVVFYNTRLVSRRENSDKDNDADDKKPAMNDDDGDGDDDDDDGSVGYGPRDELSTVHELLPLAPPGKQSVLTIKSALNKDPFSDGLDIEEEYGHPAQDTTTSSQDKEDHVETNPLDLAFHHVIQLFSNAKCVKKPKTKYEPVDSKSLWIKKWILTLQFGHCLLLLPVLLLLLLLILLLLLLPRTNLHFRTRNSMTRLAQTLRPRASPWRV